MQDIMNDSLIASHKTDVKMPSKQKGARLSRAPFYTTYYFQIISSGLLLPEPRQHP